MSEIGFPFNKVTAINCRCDIRTVSSRENADFSVTMDAIFQGRHVLIRFVIVSGFQGCLLIALCSISIF